jgi:hypothetical protein
MTHPPQFAGLAVPKGDNVVGQERYYKIIAIPADRYFSPIGYCAFSEGLDNIQR